ncbi:hypothetical protein [Sphingomonas hankookensis]
MAIAPAYEFKPHERPFLPGSPPRPTIRSGGGSAISRSASCWG